MNAVFADTSFYLALLNPRDLAHAGALRVGEAHRPVLLTDFILLELGNTLSGVGQRETFYRLVRRLRAHRSVRIVPASRD